MQEQSLPPIPVDTEIRARSVFNPRHFYIRFGDQAQSLLDGIDFASMNITAESIGLPCSLFTLITIIQFHEQLSDSQISEAIRTRVDLKYALHLSVTFSQVLPAKLCQGRSYLLASHQGQQVFQVLIDRLAENHFLTFKAEEAQNASFILHSVCTIHRLNDIWQKIAAAIMQMAVEHTDWLRANMLPHWIIRYGEKRVTFPDPYTDPVTHARDIGRDILYVLTQVDASKNKRLQELPEIRALREAWQQNYQPANAPGEDFQWRTTGCTRCP